MAVLQTRIFVPYTESEEDWAETLIGRAIAPLTGEFADRLAWFWFSRYGGSVDEASDEEARSLPDAYLRFVDSNGSRIHRSLRFRCALVEEARADFEQRALQRLSGPPYHATGFQPYDFVADTGGDRFLGTEHRTPGRAERRAELVTSFYMSVSKLVIDALVGPDANGRYRLETNDDAAQNPAGSSFQSLLHVFCNITRVPTEVKVFRKQGLNILGFGTYMYPPPAPPGGWDEASSHSIWF